MSNAMHQPERASLEAFLLGLLDDDQHEQVARQILSTPETLSAVQATDVRDDLVDTLRGLGGRATTADPPAVSQLIARLRQLHPADPLARTSEGALRADTEPAGNAPPNLAFLAPGQQDDEIGRLGGHRVLRRLGEGGMGLVFLAEDEALKRRVALKVIRPELAVRSEARKRFLREAQTAAALDHPHVVPIFQVGEDRGVSFLTMPLLQGESLEECLRREGQLPVAEALRIARETASGLAAAHATGLVHRDVKPANLWLQACAEGTEVPSRTVKILDFGLACAAAADGRLTQSGAVIGTPAYMSPEQANGLPLDPRSDLFSLGCVLYRMLTGVLPFQGPTCTAMLLAVVQHDPPPPHTLADVPRVVSSLVQRMLTKDPAGRPASAREVVEAIRALEAGTTASLPGPSRPLEQPRSPGDEGALSLAEQAQREHNQRDRLIGRLRRPVVTMGVGMAAILLVGFGLVMSGVIRFGGSEGPDGSSERPAGSDRARDPDPTKIPAQDVLRGSVDAWVYSKADGSARKMRLGDPGALPLRNKDMIRLEAHVTLPAYVYVFWIDTEGEAVPVYPWEPGKWGTRPAMEEKVTEVNLPQKLTRGYSITGKRGGMETILLLARETPLSLADNEVRQLFAGLSPQRPVQNERSAVWFENGKVVEHDTFRTRAHFEIADINDPVLRLQELLLDKLRLHAPFTAAVSFAKEGE